MSEGRPDRPPPRVAGLGVAAVKRGGRKRRDATDTLKKVPQTRDGARGRLPGQDTLQGEGEPAAGEEDGSL